MLCVTCNQPLNQEPYRLIGVEKNTWVSLYAHRGACEAEARRVHARTAPPSLTRERTDNTPEAEELTMEAPDPITETDAPWFGMERRR
jgi:hypothetical protein